MAVYIDASALTPLFVVEPFTTWCRETLLNTEEAWLISDFGAGEVASSLSKRVRMGLLDSAVAAQMLVAFDFWTRTNCSSVTTSAADIEAAATLVRRFELKLRMPDALHLAITRRSAATLVTLDKGLWQAAKAVGVEVAALPA